MGYFHAVTDEFHKLLMRLTRLAMLDYWQIVEEKSLGVNVARAFLPQRSRVLE